MTSKNYKIKQISTGVWKENCYIISNSANQGLLIDPGAEAKKIDNYIIKNRIKLLAIINTHGHYDHIGAVSFFKKKYSLPFYLHSKDEKLSKSANLYVKIFESKKFIDIPEIDFFIDDIDTPLVLDQFSVECIESPGHTMGSICIKLENHLFTGDTILPGQVGRTDLPGGNNNKLVKSLSILSRLSPDTIIYPGHGSHSILSVEMNTINKYLIKNAT